MMGVIIDSLEIFKIDPFERDLCPQSNELHI